MGRGGCRGGHCGLFILICPGVILDENFTILAFQY